MVSPRASCFHAAEAAARRLPLIDSSLAQTLAAPVAQTGEILSAEGRSARAFWRRTVPLAVKPSDHRQLALAALADEGQSQPDAALVEPVAAGLEAVEQAVRRHWPRLDEELRLRERPLREQWEARGPGFLRRLAALLGLDGALEQADVVLVHPCLGGGGEAHPEFGLVRLEAVLANAWSPLPETLRLGWLLAQLAIAADRTADDFDAERRRNLLAWALLPVALEAGEFVEWTQSDQRTLEAAVTAWRLPGSEGVSPRDAADILEAWRIEYVAGPLAWRDGLLHLEQQLPK